MAELFMCECSDPMHQFIIRYGGEPGNEMAGTGKRLVYFNVILHREISLLRRLKFALRYAFGRYSCRDANMAEVALGHDSVDAFKRIVAYLEGEDSSGFEPQDCVIGTEEYPSGGIQRCSEHPGGQKTSAPPS